MIGVVGAAVLLGGCAKKAVKPEAAAPVAEEKVTAPESPSAVEQPAIGESEVAAREEMAERPMGMAAELSSIYFDFDKSMIREDMRASLEANGRWLLANPKAAVTIQGHADERGTNEYNLALGERRARAIKQFLAAMGVDSGRLSTISYGEERPVCTESQEDCWWKNRRGQFEANK
jgi:peptidoglycan-associated lipoprotein